MCPRPELSDFRILQYSRHQGCIYSRRRLAGLVSLELYSCDSSARGVLMMRFWLLMCVAAVLIAGLIALTGSKSPALAESAANHSTAPVYTSDGKLMFPANYREWVYLTTGLDMDYSPTVNLMDHSMFDNVFVNPESYKAFVATGKWPDKTVFVLEGRIAGSKGSI